jgi:AraC-like DNA-binding protein
MQQRINTVLELNELAAFAKLSVSHFSAIFSQKTGYSPIEYFNHLKIQKACQYLLLSKIPIKDIATNLGIDDPYYFSRMFSKLMGISPNDYRKRNKSERMLSP